MNSPISLDIPCDLLNFPLGLNKDDGLAVAFSSNFLQQLVQPAANTELIFIGNIRQLKCRVLMASL
jgi:hypothetical protein